MRVRFVDRGRAAEAPPDTSPWSGERMAAEAHAALLRGPAKAGESNVNAKLTDAKVAELRAAWAGGETIKSIAGRTGLAVGTVHPMVHGRTWRHVPLVTRQALVRAAEAVAVVRSDWDAIEDAVAAMGGDDEDLFPRAASAIDGAGESGGVA
jgi:hypothetical protein